MLTAMVTLPAVVCSKENLLSNGSGVEGGLEVIVAEAVFVTNDDGEVVEASTEDGVESELEPLEVAGATQEYTAPNSPPIALAGH